MKRLIDPTEYESTLAKWHGAHAKIWILDVTLNRLAIRLSRPDDPDVLYVVGITCKHITAWFEWDNAHISITGYPLTEDDEVIPKISDKAAGFELVCSGGIGMAQGPARDCDKTFDHFLGDPEEPEQLSNKGVSLEGPENHISQRAPTSSMNRFIDPTQYESTLTKWQGANAKIWILDASLNRLAIRFSRREDPEEFYTIGVSCKHITGPFDWDNAYISITDNVDEQCTKVSDKAAGFELLCTDGIVMAQGPVGMLYKTFDKFLAAPEEPQQSSPKSGVPN